MNVVYDLIGFQSRDHGERGIARYVLHLGRALEVTNPGLVTHYLAHPELPFPAGAERLLATGRVVRTDQRVDERSPSVGGVFIAGSPFECYNQSSELVLPRFARSPEWRSVAVIHDLIPVLFPDDYLRSNYERHYFGARLNALRGFDRFLANSQTTADDACALLGIDPEHVTVIGAGADDRFRPAPVGHDQAVADLVHEGAIPGLRPGYILFPTGIDPRKNIERTIIAYGRLPVEVRRRHQLVLVCRLSEPDRRIVHDMARDAGLGSELIVTGYVSDHLLCRLYQAAHLVIFPSLYEGFGLPALEAMKCGAPVICADASSLREVQQVAEARFDPESVVEIAAAIRRALVDHEFRTALRHQELPPFSWERAAELAAGVVGELLSGLESRRATTGVSRQRLALVSPLPPQKTGVATYAYRLLEELRLLCDVTVFVDTDPDQVVAPTGVTVEPVERFGAIAGGGGAFDRILYFVGNSRFHLPALEMLAENPGDVLFHDVRLTELYREMHRLHPDRLVDRSVGSTLAATYPGRYRPEVEEMTTISQEVAHRFGILMARDAAGMAERIFVHSHYAASLLAIDCDAEATAVLAQPCPEPFDAPVMVDGPPIVATFGVVAPAKQPRKLIAALPHVHRHLPAARLRFVGPIEDHVRRALESRARAEGVADAVEFTGALDDDEFAEAHGDVSVAVQLRAFSNGESSAAVSELLARGVPTIVTDLGSMAELPDEAVVKVPLDVGAGVLGEAIAALLADPDERLRLSTAGRAYGREHSFADAATTLYEALFTPEADPREAPMDELLEPVQRNQEQTLFYLDLIKNGQSAYLGDHRVLTRLFTGQKIYVDSRDLSVAPAIVMDGRWEPETTAVLMRLLGPSQVFIDVGANFGYFGLIAGTIIDREHGGAIHMIEANPGLIPLLHKSISVCGLLGTATVANFAISDSGGTAELHVPKDLWGSSCLDQVSEQFRQEVESSMAGPLELERVLEVEAITLDDFTARRGIERVDLIKIDIEGHEERAYEGMTGVIDRNLDNLRMLIEFSASQYRDPVGFFDRIRSDFKFVYGIEPGSATLREVMTYRDVTTLSRPGFAMLLTANADLGVG